jgi:hypothetical protein
VKARGAARHAGRAKLRGERARAREKGCSEQEGSKRACAVGTRRWWRSHAPTQRRLTRSHRLLRLVWITLLFLFPFPVARTRCRRHGPIASEQSFQLVSVGEVERGPLLELPDHDADLVFRHIAACGDSESSVRLTCNVIARYDLLGVLKVQIKKYRAMGVLFVNYGSDLRVGDFCRGHSCATWLRSCSRDKSSRGENGIGS